MFEEYLRSVCGEGYIKVYPIFINILSILSVMWVCGVVFVWVVFIVLVDTHLK